MSNEGRIGKYFVQPFAITLTSYQKIGVYTMECVGYDEGFQRQVADKWANWLSPPAKKKRKSKQQPGRGNGKKRKLEVANRKGRSNFQHEVDEETANTESESEHSEDDKEEDSVTSATQPPSGTHRRQRPMLLR
jgi:hypothetical protein